VVSISTCSMLHIFYLINCLTACLFLSNIGVVPAEIGQLTELEVLHLKDNSFNVSSYFRYLLKIS